MQNWIDTGLWLSFYCAALVFILGWLFYSVSDSDGGDG